MQHRRFFLPQSVQGDAVTVTDHRLLHKWRAVLRADTGYELTLFDGSGFEYGGRIDELSADHATVTIIAQRSVEPIAPSVWLYVGLIKRDKFEWLLEKVTEVGVAGVIPLDCDRSQKKDLKYERARKIMVDAAEQSGRAWLPEIGAINTVEGVTCGSDRHMASAVMLDQMGAGSQDALRQRGAEHICVFIGPEGGWSHRERSAFEKADIVSVSLGSQNVKTETAAVSTAALTLLVA